MGQDLASAGVAGADDVEPKAPLTVSKTIIVDLGVVVGGLSAGAPVHVEGKHLAPFTEVVVKVHSNPTEVARVMTDAIGSFVLDVVLPPRLETGNHEITVMATSASGSPVVAVLPFTVNKGKITAIAPAPLELSRFSSTKLPGASLQGLDSHAYQALSAIVSQMWGGGFATFTPSEHPDQVVATQINFFTLLAMLGTAGPALASKSNRSRRDPSEIDDASETDPTSSDSRERAEVSAADVSFLGFQSAHLGPGDASRTWQVPGTTWLDRSSLSVPERVGRFAPILARVLADATYLRAMFGGASLILPVLGVTLGEAAGLNGAGRYLPPALGWVFALLLLGVFDAFAGLLAAITYAMTTVVIGGFPTADGARATMGLLALWFAPTLIGATMRPLRRLPSVTLAGRWDRIADVAIGPFFAAWGAYAIADSQNALSGFTLPIASAAGTIAWLTFGAMGVRFLLETVASNFYPNRLTLTDPGEISPPTRRQMAVSLALRSALFLFVAAAFLPFVWQLWAALALFLVPYVIGWFGDLVPNRPLVFRYIPQGLLKASVLLLVLLGLGRWLTWHQPDPGRRMFEALVVLAVPGTLFALFAVMGRSGERPTVQWWNRVAGIPLLGLLLYLKL